MRFTESHEWIDMQGLIGTVGITTHAQKELGAIVYVELPPVGKILEALQEAVVLESTKAASDVYSPVSGKVIAVNEALRASCELINHSPELHGWLFKIELSFPSEMHKLMEKEEYLQLIQN